jgi:hypothetical protein
VICTGTESTPARYVTSIIGRKCPLLKTVGDLRENCGTSFEYGIRKLFEFAKE